MITGNGDLTQKEYPIFYDYYFTIGGFFFDLAVQIADHDTSRRVTVFNS